MRVYKEKDMGYGDLENAQADLEQLCTILNRQGVTFLGKAVDTYVDHVCRKFNISHAEQALVRVSIEHDLKQALDTRV